MTSYTYRLSSNYGGPEDDMAPVKITDVQVAADGLSAMLTCEGLRPGYVHELHLPGVRSTDATPLLHPVAYYTLVNIPKQ